MKTKYNWLLTLALTFIVQITFAQEKTISGIVSDDTGPLPGVSIIKKGTSIGTETDFDGKYSIKAKTGDVLLFSFVGMETASKTVTASNTINVVLKNGNELDEIILTGVAGATDRKKLSVTVNSVTAKDIAKVPATSAAGILQAKVPGVTVTNLGQPGAGATIQLRGATNLFGGQDPLILVDGVILEGGLQDINSNDIESIEIVKGASAAGIYGSRAGNGVVVITTKKGRKNQKPQITLISDVGLSFINNKIDLSKSHNFELADDWEDYKGIYTKYNGVTYPDNYNGVGNVGLSGARISSDGYNDNPYGVNYDHQDRFFKTGLDRTLYASLSAGSEKTNMFFSAESTKQEGVFEAVGGYERYSVRANIDFQVNDWLKITTRNNYIRTNNETPGGTLGPVLFDLVLQEQDVNLYADNPDGQPFYFIPNPWATNVQNPLYSLNNNREKARQSRFLGGYNANIKFTDWLNLDAEYTFENTGWTNNDYEPFTTYTVSDNEIGFAYDEGSYFKESETTISQKAQFSLNYLDSFGDLNIKGKLSYLIEDVYYDYLSTGGFGFAYQGLESLDNVTGNILIESDNEHQLAKNFFAIVGLDFKDRYILDGMYRVDESSLFGANERRNSYYRLSGAYRISKDIQIKGVDELKVHAAYGTAGQRPGFDWQYSVVEIENGSLSTDRTANNPDLKPSTTTEFEVGLDASLFNNRIDFTGAYSTAKTEDQFMLVDIFSPANEGANKQWQNVGTVEFSTIELALNADVIKTEDLTWNLGLRFEKTVNEITQLNVDPITVGPDLFVEAGVLFRIDEGEEFGAMYGREFVTSLSQMENQLPTGTTIENYAVNSDGVVVDASTIGTQYESPIILLDEDGEQAFNKIGSQTPDFRAGVTSTLSYKNIDFYMLWDWQQGGDIYNRQGQWLTRDNRHEMTDQAGKDASDYKHFNYYQGLYDTNEVNGFWVEDGSYVKLREASVFYTFKKENLANVANGFFDSIRFGLTGRNLLTFTNYSGWDPEVQLLDPNDDTQNYYAVDYGVYPTPTSYTFTVQVKF